MDPDTVAFGERLAALGLNETALAVALLWFLDQQSTASESAPSHLATLLHDLALRGKINSHRLGSKLASHPDVVRGKQPGTFKLKLSSKAALAEKYIPLLRRPAPKVDDLVLSREDFAGTRRHLEELVREINGTYQYGFFDGCIVLCRRLIEILLIEAFEHAGEAAAIKQNNNYNQLSDIIAAARSGHHIKLARNTGKSLEEIKEAGDAGAHSRTYLTKQPDIDDLKLTLRRVVAELMQLAGMHAKRK